MAFTVQTSHIPKDYTAIIPHSERFEYVKIVELKIEWPIAYDVFYSEIYLTGRGRKVMSPIFTTESNNDLKWQISVYPNGINKSNEDYVSLYVSLLPSDKNAEVLAKIKFSMVNECGTKLNAQEMLMTQTFPTGNKSLRSGFDNFIRRSCLKHPSFICQESTLTIVCEIKGILEISDQGINKGDVPMLEYRFPKNLQALYESKKFSDVTIIISGQTFQAHRVVLATHSTVFFAMFEHEMSERIHNEVNIMDVPPEVFNEMLRYMYTGQVTGIETMADLLLVAADKYALVELKTMSEEALCKNIDVENAADMLILADDHNASQLKKRTLKFISSVTTNVMATSGFKSMVTSYPHLVVETLHALAASVERKALC